MTKDEVIERIRGFANLESGWMNGEGIPIAPGAIARACELAKEGSTVFATLAGGVQFEGHDWEHRVYADGTDELVWFDDSFEPVDDCDRCDGYGAVDADDDSGDEYVCPKCVGRGHA